MSADGGQHPAISSSAAKLGPRRLAGRHARADGKRRYAYVLMLLAAAASDADVGGKRAIVRAVWSPRRRRS